LRKEKQTLQVKRDRQPWLSRKFPVIHHRDLIAELLDGIVVDDGPLAEQALYFPA
jgi:hypothetical protein